MFCPNLFKSLLRYLQKVFHMKVFFLFSFLYMFGIFFLQNRKLSRKVQIFVELFDDTDSVMYIHCKLQCNITKILQRYKSAKY